MRYWDFPRDVTSMRVMADLAVEHGLSSRRALAGTDVSRAQLQDPRAVVTGRQELRLIHNVVDALDHVAGLGIEAGQRYHFTAFGALGFAMVSSQTLRDAIEIGLHYIRLTFAFCRFELHDEVGRVHLVMDDGEVPDGVRRFVVERDSACVITLQRDLFDRVAPLRALRLTYDDPGYTDHYQAFYGVDPAFRSEHNDLVFDRARLMRRLPQANDLARHTAQQQCEALLDQRRRRDGLSARVRAHLAAHAAEMPTMQQVAEGFTMVPRTLRRRLLDADTTFTELRDEVRQALAEEYLSGSTLTVQQVAARLGYAEPTTFINAYRRWHGSTPGARARASQRG